MSTQNTKRTNSTRRTKAAPPAPKKPSSRNTGSGAGTDRWRKETLTDGHWIKVPKLLFTHLGELRQEPKADTALAKKTRGAFQLKPCHLWLILVLQAKKYKDTPNRAFWARLGGMAGVSSDTVRRWAYELRDCGLLTIENTRKRSEGENHRTGYRNDSNIFSVEPFEDFIVPVHKSILKEKKKASRPKEEQE